jgi:hypothetical protein
MGKRGGEGVGQGTGRGVSVVKRGGKGSKSGKKGKPRFWKKGEVKG